MKFILSVSFCFLSLFMFGQDQFFPKEKHEQFQIDINTFYKDNNIVIEINNTLKSPIRLIVVTNDNALNKKHKLNDTLVINALENKKIKYFVPSKKSFQYYYSTFLGNTEQSILKNEISLPFPKGKTYKIIQGYNGNFSHNDEYNRYSIDFNLNVNDTISSADDGVVVGVIKDYVHGGTSKLWKENDRSNFVTIYHPHSGIYTQYVHLVHQGSLVKVGDFVKKGQPIALSGMTGFTTVSHLHFNVLIPKKGKILTSTPIMFENNLKGEDLKIGNEISH